MHSTRVKLKDGKVLYSPIKEWRPIDGWFKLFGIEEKIWFKDVELAVTPNERIGPGKIGDDDVLASARDYMRKAREFGWDGVTKDTPKQEWEEVNDA